jgi:RNA polymerase sigma-32 factor
MNRALALAPDMVSLNAANIDFYMQSVNAISTLTAEEEKELGRQFRDSEDLNAAQRLIMSQLKFVVHISKTYKGYGLPLADLIQEGNIGLMKAVKRFDPEMNVRLISFAVHWIKAEIHEYVIRNWRTVKIATTKAQRKLFFKLRGSKKRLGWFTHQEVLNVAEKLDVKPETVIQMEARLSNYDASYDAPGEANDEDAYSPEHYLHAEDNDPAQLHEIKDYQQHRQGKMFTAMKELDARSQDILTRRWLADKKATLHELAAHYNVSAERIRQIEKNAMNKIQKYILA